MVVKSFDNLYQLTQWVSIEENINQLKKQYPSTKYKAEMNIFDCNIVVTEKKDCEGVCDPFNFFYS